MPATPVREATVTVDHPAILWDWSRVDVRDHPDVKALYEGAPDLGWTADPRLCLYKNDQVGAVILVRLENDNEYRTVLRRELTPDERLFLKTDLLGPQSVNKMIGHLIAHDRQRGVDSSVLLDRTLGHADRRQVAADKALTEWIREDIADRLWWALGRSYWPGVGIVPRQAPSRR